MLVKRWMTSEVISVQTGTTLKEAATLMWQHQIRQLPVLEGEKFVGMLHDRDLFASDLRNPDADIFQAQPILEKVCVEDRMQTHIPFVTPETNFEAVVTILLKKKISAVPVIEGGHLVGIVCDDDLFRAFAEITGLKENGLRFSMKMRRSNGPMRRIAEILDRFDDAVMGILTFTLPDKPEFIKVMFQVRPDSAPEILRFMESKGYQTDNLLKLFQSVLAN